MTLPGITALEETRQRNGGLLLTAQQVPMRAAPDQPDANDAKRVALVQGLWHSQDAAYRSRDREIEEHVRMVLGQQWSVYNPMLGRWIDVAELDAALICGPEPMMQSVSAALATAGVPPSRIRIERFTSAAQSGRLARPAPSQAAAAREEGTRLSVTLDGATRTIEMAPGMTVLEAALAADIDVPYACRAGVCSTCRCRVTEGEVEMAANHALEDYEVAQGFRLSCQSFPLTARVAVDYDQ